jgi:uncharacterized membrane protein
MDEQTNQNQTQSPAPEAPKEQQADPKDVQENKLWAILGYLGILCLIPLLAKKDSKFAQFHAKQGLILLIGEFFVWVPILGWLLGIVIFVFWIMGIINVLNGKMTPLPIVGELAAKLNI